VESGEGGSKKKKTKGRKGGKNPYRYRGERRNEATWRAESLGEPSEERSRRKQAPSSQVIAVRSSSGIRGEAQVEETLRRLRGGNNNGGRTPGPRGPYGDML